MATAGSFGTGYNAIGGAPRGPGRAGAGAPPRVGFGASGGTEFGRNIGSGFTGLTAAKPPKGPVAAPTQPVNSGTTAPPSPGNAPIAPSPYDSTYYIDLADATAKANNQINTYNADIANGQTALNTNLTALQQNQGLQTRNAQNAENARGGFALGALGNTTGQIAQNSFNAQAAQSLRFQQNQQAWTNAIGSVRQGLSNEQIALQLAAADRAAKINAASGGTIGGTPGTPGSPAAPTAPAAPAPPARGTLGASLTGLHAAPAPKPFRIGAGIPKAKPGQIGYRGGF